MGKQFLIITLPFAAVSGAGAVLRLFLRFLEGIERRHRSVFKVQIVTVYEWLSWKF